MPYHEVLYFFLTENNLSLSVQSNFWKPVVNSETENAKKRLDDRMYLYGVETKRRIPGDGNCQMYSLSDQLCNSIDHHKFVRRCIVSWLSINGDLELPNGAKMKDFVHDKTWEKYCEEMGREGIWGDHLTLVAASE